MASVTSVKCFCLQSCYPVANYIKVVKRKSFSFKWLGVTVHYCDRACNKTLQQVSSSWGPLPRRLSARINEHTQHAGERKKHTTPQNTQKLRRSICGYWTKHEIKNRRLLVWRSWIIEWTREHDAIDVILLCADHLARQSVVGCRTFSSAGKNILLWKLKLFTVKQLTNYM